MSSWDEIRGNDQATRMRTASLERVDPNLREALGHALAQIILMMEMIMPMGDTVDQLQGRVDDVTQQSGKTQRRLGVLENKAVASIKTLISDKTTFRSWNEKLIHVLSQARQGCRGISRAKAEHADQDTTGDFETTFEDTQDCRDVESRGSTHRDIIEGLYILLVDKTEGEASVRPRGRSHGDGVSAYMAIYKWFMGASGQAITERIRKLRSPLAPKGEQDIADAIDRWIESARTLKNMKPEHKLQDPFKVTALESLTNVGQGKVYFENLKVQGLEFEEILAKCKDYAIRRRLDRAHEKYPDDMDIGAVQTCAETYQDWSQEWDMRGDYMSSGEPLV